MSWLYSRALVEEYSEATCSAGTQSPPLSGSPTPQAFLPSDRMTAFSRPSRFGMTFAPLTGDLGAELLTWFLEASRAKTSALPVRAQASAENDPECGPTWRGSLAKFDPDTRSWKTAQLCLLGDSELSSVTWPRSGMTADGQCWELPMSERRTNATGFGSWPTPTVCGNYNRKGASATSGDGLATAVAMSLITTNSESMGAQTAKAMVFPTPTRRDHKGGYTTEALTRKDGKSRKFDALPNAVLNGAGVETSDGTLNPTWVEWLMGWPLGWTDLKPLETDKYLHVLPRRGAD